MAMLLIQTIGAEEDVRQYLNKTAGDLNYMFLHLDDRNIPQLASTMENMQRLKSALEVVAFAMGEPTQSQVSQILNGWK